MRAQYISSGQNSFVLDTMGQNCFVPGFVPGTKITPLVLSRGQKSHLWFCPGDKNHTFFLAALLLRLATTMQLPASGCRLLPPLLIILPPLLRVQVTMTTTRTKQMSRPRKRGWMPMGEGNNNPMTTWHWLSGSWHCLTPAPMVGGNRHQTT